jgi:hypothetical protein
VLRLRGQLGRFDPQQVAEVGARVREACCCTSEAEAEETALVVTLHVLELRRQDEERAERRSA